MKKCFALILGFFAVLSSNIAFAGTLPFTDVTAESPYYSSVASLYASHIISDDGSHLFRPLDTVYRDAFVGLSVSVSCKQCITPTLDDIVKYSVSPFIDLSKNNPFYYCIAYAADKKIVQGYTLNTSGNEECQDGGVFQSNPFCEKNKTTRIEAVAMLLRQANLWNDELNKTVSKTREIRDVSDYWYGYASKGIDAGILSLKANNTVGPDEYVTRGEFANMAAKMLSYNQCIKAGSQNSLAGAIGIVGQNGVKLDQSVFSLSDNFSLVPLLSTDINTYRYEWKALDSITGKMITRTDLKLLSSTLGVGDWYVELSVIDKNTNEVLSTPTTTITISDGKVLDNTSGNPSGNGGEKNTSNGINGAVVPSIILSASSLSADIGGKIDFSTYALGTGPLTYNWDFGDGTRSASSPNIGSSHTYSTPGTYTVTVTMADANGKSAQSSVIIEITGDIDTDGDSVPDIYDACPSVSGSKDNKGCPIIAINNYTKGVDTGITGTNSHFGNSSGPILTNNGIIGIGSTISIVGKNGENLAGTTFSKGQYFDLVSVVGTPGNYTYSWKAVDSITGKGVTGTDTHLLGSLLGIGNWYVTLSTMDKNTGSRVSTASTTITVGDSSSLPSGTVGSGNGGIGSTNVGIGNNLYPSVSISASTLNIPAGGTIDFSTLSYGVGPFTYNWNFGDGTNISSVSGSSGGNQSHVFSTPGTYTINVSMTDANGKVVYSTVTIVVGSSGTNNTSSDIKVSSDIAIVNNENTPLSKTSFASGEYFSLIPVIGNPGAYNYTWKAVDSVTGGIITSNDSRLLGSLLGRGNWYVTLSTTDKNTGALVSTASTTISIGDGSSLQSGTVGSGNGGTGAGSSLAGSLYPSLTLDASALNVAVGSMVSFSTLSYGVGPFTYNWDFGDGTRLNIPTGALGSINQTHIYTSPGIYTVTVTMTDANGKIVRSTLTMSIINNIAPIGSQITIIDGQNNTVSKTSFKSTDIFSLVANLSSPGDYSYTWTAIDTVTGKTVTGVGTMLAGTDLSVGNWSVLLSIRDNTTDTVIGTPRTTINITDGTSEKNIPAIGGVAFPTISLSANTLSTTIDDTIHFSTITSGLGPLTYTWNFGDGSAPVGGGSTLSHTFATPGNYTISVKITDASGKTAQSNIIINIVDKDTDGDGVSDNLDACPNVGGPPDNKGCPIVDSLLGDLDKNACLMDKARTRGLIIASPVCTQCPCTNSITFSAGARSCDILFPAILSRDFQTVYSRGGFYQLP